jgi:hypothetical protein
MMIVIASSALGSFSITTLPDGVDLMSSSDLGSPITVFFPFVVSACSS